MPVRRLRRLTGRMFADPDAVARIAVVVLTLGSEGRGLDSRLGTITASVEKIQTMTQVVGKTMASLQDAAALPERLRTVMATGRPQTAANKTTKTVGTV